MTMISKKMFNFHFKVFQFTHVYIFAISLVVNVPKEIKQKKNKYSFFVIVLHLYIMANELMDISGSSCFSVCLSGGQQKDWWLIRGRKPAS